MTEAKGTSRWSRLTNWRVLGAVALVACVVAVGIFVFSDSEELWRSAGASDAPSAAGEILAGRWIGTWQSRTRDMGGKLRCVIVRLEDGTYDATFLATTLGLVEVEQRVVLSADKSTSTWKLSGRKDLGWMMGGMYQYAGTCDGADLVCTYQSSADAGTFTLARPERRDAPESK